MKLLKVKGIGLLELMLSLAIIAILLIMATRYYESASDSQKISQAVDMYAAIKGAEQSYFSSQIGGTAAPVAGTLALLVGAGYLPASYLDTGVYSSGATSANSSPWGTAIDLAAGTGSVQVSMVVPDENSCTSLLNKLIGTVSSEGGESISVGDIGASTSSGKCAAGSNTVTANYILTQ